jgi:histidinol phosphatase-like enzyme
MYSPKIEENLVMRLYALKVAYAKIGIRKPMTKIVADALNKYIPKAEREVNCGFRDSSLQDVNTAKV